MPETMTAELRRIDLADAASDENAHRCDICREATGVAWFAEALWLCSPCNERMLRRLERCR